MIDVNLNKQLKLDLIRSDGGTQQRPLDEDILSHYLSLMQDGVEFPPIEIVSNGVNFWLWDGFHRLECARRRDQKVIAAYVTKGTLRDAIWLSFGANKTHGLPRQKGIAKEIIKQILRDKRWSKQSLSAIARHIGVTKQYVSKVKEQLLGAIGQPVDPCASKNSNSDSKSESHDATDCTIETDEPELQRADEIEVERSGKTYTQKSQEKRHQVSEPHRDKVGEVIPEHLRELWEGRDLLEGFVRDLTNLKTQLMKHVEARDPRLSLLVQHQSRINSLRSHYENLRRTLKMSIFYAVCRHCGGDAKDCKHCRGIGLISKFDYETTTQRGLKR